MAWSKSILKENRFPKTLQKLPVSICQHLNITNLLCHGERSGPVTKHWGTSQSVTDGRPASVLTSHKTCQSWPVIRLVMRRFTCWQLTALKNFLSGQECNRSHCFSAAISLNVSLSAQVAAFRKLLVTKSNPLYFRGQRRGGHLAFDLWSIKGLIWLVGLIQSYLRLADFNSEQKIKTGQRKQSFVGEIVSVDSFCFNRQSLWELVMSASLRAQGSEWRWWEGWRGFCTELPPPQFALSLTSDKRKEWERKANRLFVTPFTFNGLWDDPLWVGEVQSYAKSYLASRRLGSQHGLLLRPLVDHWDQAGLTPLHPGLCQWHGLAGCLPTPANGQPVRPLRPESFCQPGGR